jgi:hypothetical protein
MGVLEGMFSLREPLVSVAFFLPSPSQTLLRSLSEYVPSYRSYRVIGIHTMMGAKVRRATVSEKQRAVALLVALGQFNYRQIAQQAQCHYNSITAWMKNAQVLALVLRFIIDAQVYAAFFRPLCWAAANAL